MRQRGKREINRLDKWERERKHQLDCILQFNIFSGKDWPDKFSKIEIIKTFDYDETLGSVYSLQYSFDGEILAVGYSNGAIRARCNKISCDIFRDRTS